VPLGVEATAGQLELGLRQIFERDQRRPSEEHDPISVGPGQRRLRLRRVGQLDQLRHGLAITAGRLDRGSHGCRGYERNEQERAQHDVLLAKTRIGADDCADVNAVPHVSMLT
jgi:hypothetical protein